MMMMMMIMIVRSMMEMANASLSHDEVGRLVDQMFVSSGLERSSSLKFKDFTRLVNDKMDMLWDVCLDWKGGAVFRHMGDLKPRSLLRAALHV